MTAKIVRLTVANRCAKSFEYGLLSDVLQVVLQFFFKENL